MMMSVLDSEGVIRRRNHQLKQCVYQNKSTYTYTYIVKFY